MDDLAAIAEAIGKGQCLSGSAPATAAPRAVDKERFRTKEIPCHLNSSPPI
jgi:hypothetical protein